MTMTKSYVRKSIHDSSTAGTTRVAFDTLLARIEYCKSRLDAFRDSKVRKMNAEKELEKSLGRAATFLEAASLGRNKTRLVEIFKGNCDGITHLRMLCESLEMTSDAKRQACLAACTSAEKALIGAGLGRELMTALDAMLDDGDDAPEHECIPHIAGAAVVNEEAILCERDGNYEEAVTKYNDTKKCLQSAVQVLRAAAKMKSSLKDTWATRDVVQIESYIQQISQRIEDISNLEENQAPAVPVEEALEPLVLEMHEDVAVRQQVIASAGALTALYGISLLTPVGLALAAGATLFSFISTSEELEFPELEFPELDFPQLEFPEFPNVEFPKVEFPKLEFASKFPELPQLANA